MRKVACLVFVGFVGSLSGSHRTNHSKPQSLDSVITVIEQVNSATQHMDTSLRRLDLNIHKKPSP